MFFKRRRKAKAHRARGGFQSCLDGLEDRSLPSASPLGPAHAGTPQVHDHAVVGHPAPLSVRTAGVPAPAVAAVGSSSPGSRLAPLDGPRPVGTSRPRPFVALPCPGAGSRDRGSDQEKLLIAPAISVEGHLPRILKGQR